MKTLLLLIAFANCFASAPPQARLIPLPIYSTLPNEGNTFGFMPVFLFVEPNSERTERILAPSVSWNSTIQFTGTLRLYEYPSQKDQLTAIASISSRINRNFTFQFEHSPGDDTKEPWPWSLEISAHGRRNIFYRFFGLGPESLMGSESSYTRVGGDLNARAGLRVASRLNIGFRFWGDRTLIERTHISGLPLATSAFPGTAGFSGATAIGEGFSLRFDSRPRREYSEEGAFAELGVLWSQGLAGSPDFVRTNLESRANWTELAWLHGAARLYASLVASDERLPFYYRSSLGGSSFLRGFTEDRFIDRGSWVLELEQRITAFTTRIYGVTADWRLDPFLSIGQVFSRSDELFSHPRFAGGLGFRAFVRSNILGRVDTALGGEGVKVYVELGYPF